MLKKRNVEILDLKQRKKVFVARFKTKMFVISDLKERKKERESM